MRDVRQLAELERAVEIAINIFEGSVHALGILSTATL
jgi:hypothetical protein